MKRVYSPTVIMFLFLISLISGSGLPEKAMSSTIHESERGSGIQKTGPLAVTVGDFPAEGFILDIGGGGEGIIGQVKGAQVIAIDISQRELEEAPPGPLKIVMDARELKFLDKTFLTSTVFFTFMYIDDGDHLKVFREIHRVLEKGGRLLIWDVILPENTDPPKKMALFPLKINIPGKTVSTGYGVRWPQAGRPLARYLELAGKTGFEVVETKPDDRWFYLELKKK